MNVKLKFIIVTIFDIISDQISKIVLLI